MVRCCSVSTGKWIYTEPAHQARFTVVLLFRVGRHTINNEGLELNRCTVLWYDIVRCWQMNGSTTGSAKHASQWFIVQCRKAYNEGLEFNRCTVLWYDTVQCWHTNGSTTGSLNTLHSGVIVQRM